MADVESPTAEAQTPRPTTPDLRVARVQAARKHPDADRLLLLDIDLGIEKRQIVAGIALHYDPAELEGKQIVVVANLQPAQIRGQVSQGMLLAAENEEKRLGLLEAPDAAPGTPLRATGADEPPAQITVTDFKEHMLVADAQGVMLDGRRLEGAGLRMDRGVYGRLR